jgi:glycerol-3-phosphate dehydrogenase
LDKEFVPNDHAIMIPKTDDGRVLFAVPWHNKVVVGTTDVHKDTAELEPRALEEEIDFILETAGRFLTKKPKRSDVKSVFAGLRPLAAPTGEGKKTKEISRGHKIYTSDAGLVTIIGGKWTTYRQMAEELVDAASKVASIELKKSVTRNLPLHGWKKNIDLNDPLYFYGSDAEKILALAKEDKDLATYLSKDLEIIKAQVVWAVRHEMARTLEDVLSRRTRALLLDARESARIAPEVAIIMAIELEQDEVWIQNQIEEYTSLAGNYLLN